MDDEDNKEEEEGEDLKPLPDILTSISNRFKSEASSSAPSSSSFTGAAASSKPELVEDVTSSSDPKPFVEPEAPPNSVERTVSAYDEDDFLNTGCDSEDIELF